MNLVAQIHIQPLGQIVPQTMQFEINVKYEININSQISLPPLVPIFSQNIIFHNARIENNIKGSGGGDIDSL